MVLGGWVLPRTVLSWAKAARWAGDAAKAGLVLGQEVLRWLAAVNTATADHAQKRGPLRHALLKRRGERRAFGVVTEGEVGLRG